MSHWAVGLVIFHTLFYAVFIPRAAARLLAAARAQASAAGSAGGAENGAPGLTERDHEQQAGERPRGVRTARFAGSLVAFHMLALAVLYNGLMPALSGSPTLIEPRHVAGAALMAAASALAAWALVVFRSWRIWASLTPDHQLVTGGPYRWVRHPIYLAMDLLAVGSWLWAPGAVAAVGAALVMVAGDLRGRAEESLLQEELGVPYRDYMRRVRRFVPGIY
ncbi:MAG TPA: isoprenylcysteine carboxylmethyltransferase family protein [Thermoanaerobaculia bacterium]|nr:isoprenylcysteine carboxylmethyltransferase family protein [Thermoanaerobaculia bacterium]